jgi:hypothetical protein
METITGETRGTLLNRGECVSAHDDCACHLTNVPRSPDDDNGFRALGDVVLQSAADCWATPIPTPVASAPLGSASSERPHTAVVIMLYQHLGVEELADDHAGLGAARQSPSKSSSI